MTIPATAPPMSPNIRMPNKIMSAAGTIFIGREYAASDRTSDSRSARTRLFSITKRTPCMPFYFSAADSPSVPSCDCV